MIEIRFSAETKEKLWDQIVSFIGEDVCTPAPIPVQSAPVESAPTATATKSTEPTPIKRPRGRPAQKAAEAPAAPAATEPEPPLGPENEAACDLHAAFLPEGVNQIKGAGCKRCEAVKPPPPAAPPVAAADSMAALRAKMREWVIAKAVTVDAMTNWLLSYGSADLAGIGPDRHAGMIRDLDERIGRAPVKDPLA